MISFPLSLIGELSFEHNLQLVKVIVQLLQSCLLVRGILLLTL